MARGAAGGIGVTLGWWEGAAGHSVEQTGTICSLSEHRPAGLWATQCIRILLPQVGGARAAAFRGAGVPPRLVVLYSHLNRMGTNGSQALRAAELEMLSSKVYTHPHYWSAFGITGRID